MSLFLIGACKKDTPPVSEEKKIELENHWIYPIPEGETPVVVYAKDDRVIYLTKGEGISSSKLANCYIFSIEGEFIVSKPITQYLDYLPSIVNIYSNGEWLCLSSPYRFTLFNIQTGDIIFKKNDLDLVGDKSFNHFLSDNDRVYFTKISPSNHVLLQSLNLINMNEEIIDTIAFQPTSSYPNLNRLVGIIGPDPNQSMAYRTHIYNRLVYGKIADGFENYFDIHTYYKTNQSHMTSKNSTDMIDFNNRFGRASNILHADADKKIYFSIGSSLYAFDLLTRKVLWKRKFGFNVLNNLTLINNKLALTLYDVAAVFLIDCNTGEQVWATDIGVHYTFQMAYSSGYLIVPSNGNSGTSQMTIDFIDFKKGGTVFKTTSPHPTEVTPQSPFYMQLMGSVATHDDILFCADGKNFMALKMKVK